MFSAVLRVFTPPLKKIHVPLSSFDLSCFRRRTESFPFTRSISRFEDALRDLLSHTRRPVDTQRRARRFKPRNLPYNAFLRPARFPLCKKSSRPILPLFRRRKALSRIAEPQKSGFQEPAPQQDRAFTAFPLKIPKSTFADAENTRSKK